MNKADRFIRYIAWILSGILLLTGCSGQPTRPSDSRSESSAETAEISAVEDENAADDSAANNIAADDSVMDESSTKESAEDNSTAENSSQEEPRYGGEIAMAVLDPGTLDVRKTTRADAVQLEMLIFSPLLETDTSGRTTSDSLTESYQITEDGYTVTLHLRRNALWHNGTQVTAEDVLYTLYILAQSETDNYWKDQLASVTGADQIDYYTVDVYFNSPVDAERIQVLMLPVIPARVYDTLEAPNWNAVGSGPFRVERVTLTREILLAANDRYYGGRPYLDSIRVSLTRSEDAPRTAFLQGLIQLLYEEKPSGLSTENIYHHSVYQTETQILNFLYMNEREGRILADGTFRKAVMYAVDARKLIDQTQVHQGTVSESVIPYWLADDGLTDQYGYNPEAAYSLLGDRKQAELLLIYDEQDSVSAAQAAIVADNLEDVGMRIRLQAMTETDLQKALASGEYDLAFGQMRIRGHEDLGALLSAKGAYNYSGAEDPVLDKLLEGVSGARGRNEGILAYQAVARYCFENLPICPLYYSRQAVIVSKTVGGELTPSPSHIYSGIGNLFLRETGNGEETE
ncbi:MAG: ABC transporter substrate-binding protein [Firmicutes bacterium]|nr:ABC transporter substrate-binding protein [Bacillota bacterium]